jgi:hypothetical protein
LQSGIYSFDEPICGDWQVGVNLGKPGYLEQIAEATKDIDVQIVFCNAGYMVTGFFDSV